MLEFTINTKEIAQTIKKAAKINKEVCICCHNNDLYLYAKNLEVNYFCKLCPEKIIPDDIYFYIETKSIPINKEVHFRVDDKAVLFISGHLKGKLKKKKKKKKPLSIYDYLDVKTRKIDLSFVEKIALKDVNDIKGYDDTVYVSYREGFGVEVSTFNAITAICRYFDIDNQNIDRFALSHNTFSLLVPFIDEQSEVTVKDGKFILKTENSILVIDLLQTLDNYSNVYELNKSLEYNFNISLNGSEFLEVLEEIDKYNDSKDQVVTFIFKNDVLDIIFNTNKWKTKHTLPIFNITGDICSSVVIHFGYLSSLTSNIKCDGNITLSFTDTVMKIQNNQDIYLIALVEKK